MLGIQLMAMMLGTVRVFMPPVPCCAFPNLDKFPVNPEASISNDEITQPGVSAVLAHILIISFSVCS